MRRDKGVSGYTSGGQRRLELELGVRSALGSAEKAVGQNGHTRMRTRGGSEPTRQAHSLLVLGRICGPKQELELRQSLPA